MQTKLLKIQTELKAPKAQRNNFGGYNYRSCEDILEAVKPLLAEQNLLLTIQDELVNIGDRYYVKATAKLTDTESKETVDITAYAREEENKKGMDGSQITGASSSYARKYALNGLFLIDDTKDSDATNDHGKVTTSNEPNAAKATREQIDRIKALHKTLNLDILETTKVTGAIDQLSEGAAKAMIERLETKAQGANE